jgi:hypothetical protein
LTEECANVTTNPQQRINKIDSHHNIIVMASERLRNTFIYLRLLQQLRLRIPSVPLHNGCLVQRRLISSSITGVGRRHQSSLFLPHAVNRLAQLHSHARSAVSSRPALL